MHICATIPEYPAPIPHRSATHRVIKVHMTQSIMNLSSAVSFCLQKTNYTMDLTAGRNGDLRVHVYLVAIHAQPNKMDCGLAFNEITLYWLLEEMCHVTMATLLLAKQRLILKVPTYLISEMLFWQLQPNDLCLEFFFSLSSLIKIFLKSPHQVTVHAAYSYQSKARKSFLLTVCNNQSTIQQRAT